jgi:hypothetical protein
MKKSAILFICLLFIVPAASGQEASLKPYGIKSGIIEYSYSGNKVGKGTLYFDDYGIRSAMYTDAVESGEKKKGWVVTSGEYQYMWNPDIPVEGMKLRNPLIDWMASASKGDIESFTESIYEKMGMIKNGTETMLGKECKVLQGKMGKVIICDGLLMLLDIKMGPYISHQEATSVKTNIPVEAKYFIIPGNIQFSEMPGF